MKNGIELGEQYLDGDRPITSSGEDRLGFAPIAEKLAHAIVDEAARSGLVFGIEGEWGSGKSTLINLTIEALATHGCAAPEVLRFSPWLVGARDELLHSLFGDLAEAVAKIEPIEAAIAAEEANLSRWQRWQRSLTPTAMWRKKTVHNLKKRANASLRFFATQAGRAGRIMKLGEYAAIPFAGPTGDALGRIGESAGEFGKDASLSKKKETLEKGLRSLSRRIVIFVDDLDRLEPREISEVLRLIRAVADFPNIIYVLSYDPKVVARTLKSAVQVDDGAAFLEKIVQVSFRVPRPEAFDLRRWFQDEVSTMFADEVGRGEEAHRGVRQRVAEAVDTQGGRYLETPRDVVRALNALRLHAVPVGDQIDLADMVWLQLIRIGNPALYEWVEEYLVEVTAVANGAMLGRGEASAMERRLIDLLGAPNNEIDLALINLERILPGVSMVGGAIGNEREGSRVYQNLRADTLAPFIRDRRLGSPQHYRLYFAFAEPAGALRDSEVQAFLALAENAPDDARDRFAELANTVRPQGGVMAEVLIDRLLAWLDRIQPASIPAILRAFAYTLDDVARRTPRGDFGEHRSWNLAERAVKAFVRKAGVDRAACLRELFTNGRALGWVTSILRDEIFAHGVYGDRAEPEEQRLLTPVEFRAVLDTMLERYRTTDADTLLQVPNLLSVLYAWLQGGGGEQVRHWASARIATDPGLLSLLGRLRGWGNASDIGEYFPLRKRDLEHFLDFDEAERRLNAICTERQVTDEQNARAGELLTAIEQGRRH